MNITIVVYWPSTWFHHHNNQWNILVIKSIHVHNNAKIDYNRRSFMLIPNLVFAFLGFCDLMEKMHKLGLFS